MWNVPVLHDDGLLCFDCTDRTKHTLRRTCTTDCMQKITNNDCLFESYSESELSACLFGLEISFQEWFSKIKY